MTAKKLTETKSIIDKDYRKIIDKLKEVRLQKGWTQSEMANKIGWKHGTKVNKIELYERRLDILEFLKMASALGKSPNYFFKDIKATTRLPL